MTPTAKALRDLRRRVGSAPMRCLFEVLCGPLAQPRTPGVRFGPYRTVSFDGCSSLKAPGTAPQPGLAGSPGHRGYPQLELMTLVESGTRALIGAVFGPTGEGETGYAWRLLHLLKPDMLVLRDKGFDSNAFLAQVAATGAQILGRLRSNRRTCLGRARRWLLPHDGRHPPDPRRRGPRDRDLRGRHHRHRLLPGHHVDRRGPRYPAAALVALYPQRWEHESAYYALRHTIMQGRVLRSGDPAGLEQEMCSVLTLYQLLRTTMVDAAESRPGTDPDRCGLSIALHAARDLVVQAAGVTEYGTNLVGVIGRRVLAHLLPRRRPRVSTRKVKSPISRYHERRDDGRPDRQPVTALTIVLAAPIEPPLPTASRDDQLAALTDRRGERLLALLQEDPGRSWRPGKSPATWATSPSAPCTHSSHDGPKTASSSRSVPASTPPPRPYAG
ncbi:UNVERIFIED_ORG: hypothetical protein FHR35_006985 [Microbispora rosea subsp. rosea]